MKFKLTQLLILLGLVLNLSGCAAIPAPVSSTLTSTFTSIQSLLPSDFTISRYFRDKRDFTETQALLADAETYRDMRSLPEKAVFYERLLNQRHFEDGYFTSKLRLSVLNDPHGYSDPYTRQNVSDSAAYGSKILAFRVFQYHVGTGYDPLRYQNAFIFIRLLCTISGVPGHVVRGAVPNSLDFPKDEEDKWFEGSGIYSDWSYRSDPSPGQFASIAHSLYIAYHYGPTEYKEEAASLLRSIALRLIDNDYQIIDIDGEATQISHFDPSLPLFTIGLPDRGSIGLYLNGIIDFDPVTTNRARRNLQLLSILFASVSTSQDPIVTLAYNELLDSGYSKRASNAPFNFLGLTEPGNELSDFDEYFVLLNQTTSSLQPNKARAHFRHGLDKSWNWFKDLKHPSAIPIYLYLTPGYNILPNSDSRIIAESAQEILASSAEPNRRRSIVLSNSPDMKFSFWPSLGLDPLSSPEMVPELWQRRTSSYRLSRDPRRLDSAGDNMTEYSYVDWLYAFWLMRFVHHEKIKATQQSTIDDRLLQLRPRLQLRSRM